MTNTLNTKITLFNNILDQGELSYVGIFPVDLEIPLIFAEFTDLPAGCISRPVQGTFTKAIGPWPIYVWCAFLYEK